MDFLKNFALKHPFITFLIVDSVVTEVRRAIEVLRTGVPVGGCRTKTTYGDGKTVTEVGVTGQEVTVEGSVKTEEDDKE